MVDSFIFSRIILFLDIEINVQVCSTHECLFLASCVFLDIEINVQVVSTQEYFFSIRPTCLCKLHHVFSYIVSCGLVLARSIFASSILADMAYSGHLGITFIKQ